MTRMEWMRVPSVARLWASTAGTLRLEPAPGPLPRGKGTRLYGGRVVTGAWDGTRYIYGHKGKTHKVARLICEAFHGPPPFPGAVVMHLNENARDNRPENLRWGTQKENLNAPGFLEYCRNRTGDQSPVRKHLAKQLKEAA